MNGTHRNRSGRAILGLRLHRLGVWSAAATLAGLLVAFGSTARAQLTGGITDVYDPWNAMYRGFIYPAAPPNGALPNQARLGYFQGRSPYNAYSPFDASSPFDEGGRPAGRGVPYFDAFRRYDDQFNRNYVPNRGDTFYSNQADRQQKYMDALRERDPAKRAELLKAIEEQNRDALRDDPAARSSRRGARASGAGAGVGARTTPGGMDLRRQSGLLRRPSAVPSAPAAPDALPEPGLEPEETPATTPRTGVLRGGNSLMRPRTPLLGGGMEPSGVLDRALGLERRPGVGGVVPNPALMRPPSAPNVGLAPGVFPKPEVDPGSPTAKPRTP